MEEIIAAMYRDQGAAAPEAVAEATP
jgi:hypothetical protein